MALLDWRKTGLWELVKNWVGCLVRDRREEDCLYILLVGSAGGNYTFHTGGYISDIVCAFGM